MQAVRHDLSRGLPTRKSKLSGHLWFYVFIKMNCMCLFSVYLLMLNKFCPSPSLSPKTGSLTYCSHKPECIVTTNPDRSVLITIITWHFQFHPVNVSILCLKFAFCARCESYFACYSHCYITTGIVTPKYASSRDAALVIHYLPNLISTCLKL